MSRASGYLIVLVILSGTVSSEGWEWRNPLPSVNNIWGLEEIDPSGSMIAVGAQGSIFLTDDNWNSFTRIEVPEKVEGIDFKEVDFPTSTVGYVCGQSGCLLKSGDGGLSWKILRTGESHNTFIDIDFDNSLFGISVGCFNDLSPFDEYGMIACTYDGGSNWQISDYKYVLYGVDVFSSTKAVAVGGNGTIIMTENGGSDWTEISCPSSQTLMNVVFIDSHIGLAVGFGNTVLRTADGGYTWSEIITPVPTTVRLYDIDFSDGGSNCVVVGYNNSDPVLIVSHDAGLTWSVLNSDTPKFLLAVSHCGSLGFTAAGCWGAMTGSNQQGENWESLFQSFYSFILNCDFVSESIGFCVGNDGLIAETANGGIDWTVIEVEIDPVDLTDVSFCDNLNGIAVGDEGRVLYTIDGGNSWHVGITPVSCTLKGVEFVNSTMAVAIGEQGTLLKSEDGGITWQWYEKKLSGNLNDICFVDQLNGFICGDTDAFLKTIDGGNTWTSIPRTGAGYGTMSCIDFTDSDYGMCAGWGAKIIKTTDGGESWEMVIGGAGAFLWNDIDVVDRNIALASSVRGSVAYTETGGAEWSSVGPQTNASLFAVYYNAGSGNTIAFGAAGAILTNDDLITESGLDPDGWAVDHPVLDESPYHTSSRISVNVTNPACSNVMASITNSTSISQRISCSLYSIDGRLIMENSMDAAAGVSSSVSLFDANLLIPSGFYVIVLRYDGMEEVQKVIVLE